MVNITVNVYGICHYVEFGVICRWLCSYLVGENHIGNVEDDAAMDDLPKLRNPANDDDIYIYIKILHAMM